MRHYNFTIVTTTEQLDKFRTNFAKAQKRIKEQDVDFVKISSDMALTVEQTAKLSNELIEALLENVHAKVNEMDKLQGKLQEETMHNKTLQEQLAKL